MQGLKISKDLETTINARIADIDQLLTKQLNEIMHQAEFQKLEASWRGLKYVVQESETSPMLKIRVLNVSKEDLRRDLERSVGFDQSTLFRGLRGGITHLRRAPPRALSGYYSARRAGRKRWKDSKGGGAHAVHGGRARSHPGVLTDITAPRACPRSRSVTLPSGGRSGNPRTLATWACACPTS